MKKLIYLFFLAITEFAVGEINIETVVIENSGNSADVRSGMGGVSHRYAIGKYEVTVKQYAEFLNSIATTNTDSWIVNLWNPEMQSNPNIAGIARTGNGTAANPYIYTTIGDDTRPIACVSWFDAARFCNWMHNGGNINSSTETGAYNLNGATTSVVAKNSNAKWYIPTENEWYKSAFNKREGGYWRFASQRDTTPGAVNYRYSGGNTVFYAATGSSAWAPVSYIMPVGTFGSQSSWGTLDQSGNLNEWVDTPNGPAIRGGSWFDHDEKRLSIYGSISEQGYNENIYTGFRVAKSSAPEPANGILTLEVSNGISSGWTEIKLDASMITPEGKINIGTLTSDAEFYRLKVEAK